MKQRLSNKRGITLIALIVTIIILLILVGVAIASINGENGLFANVKLAKQKYAISETKEKLELKITELRIEEEGKGETLTKEDLPKLNSDEIDVGSTESFPVKIIYVKYVFSIDENFVVTYVGEAIGTIITYTTDPEGYTNQDEIQILIKVSNPKGIKTIEYPDGDILELGGATERGIDYKVTTNGTYNFKVIDNENNEVIKDVVVDQIDKLAPLDFTPEVTKDGSNITIISNVKDAEPDGVSTKSGIDYCEYYLIDSNNKITKYDANVIENLALGTYQIYVVAYDKAGNPKQSNLVEFEITMQLQKVVAGEVVSYGIDKHENLFVWGVNVSGQAGLGNKVSPITVPTDVKMSVIQIIEDQGHVMLIDKENSLWSWGNNHYGQVGDGTKYDQDIPIQIIPEKQFKQISAKYGVSLAIDSDGNIWGWGWNYNGQVGNGTTTDQITPIQITDGIVFKQIQIGGMSCLALDEDGNIWSWGKNQYGTLGNGTKDDEYKPKQITSEKIFKKIMASEYYTCLAIDDNDKLWTWGCNESGQVGNGTTIDQTTPIQIMPEISFIQVSVEFRNSFSYRY